MIKKNIKRIEQYINEIDSIFAAHTESQSDDFANGMHMCDAIKSELIQIQKKTETT